MKGDDSTTSPGSAWPEQELGVAVVGCGYWGVNYLRILGEIAQVNKVLAVDNRLSRLEMAAERFSDIELALDLERVLTRSDVHAVIVCTPARTHHAVARKLLDAGKHLLIEKPVTTRSEDASDLIRRADEADLVLSVGHTFLYHPAIRKVKSYVDAGHAGQVYYLYSQRTNLGPIRLDINALWDLAPHDISIFNYLLDSAPSWVSATGRSVLGNGQEDFGFVALGYPNGVMGHIHVSWADPHKVRHAVVVGSQRRIVFDDLQTVEQVRVFEKGVSPAADQAVGYDEHRLLIRDGDIISPKLEVSEPLKNQCLDFLACVADGQKPLSDGINGLAVVETMEAIDRSLARNGQPVELDELSTTMASGQLLPTTPEQHAAVPLIPEQ